MKIEDVFGDLPTLEAERLQLRKLRLSDAKALFEYASDPEVPRYTLWEPHQSIKDSEAFLETVLDQYRQCQAAPWGLVQKQEGVLIGTGGFVSWNPRHARAEVAYALARPYWGKGYMTEAVRRMIDFGFHIMQLYRIEARCMVENIASARVMEKAGMTFEGVLRGHMLAKGSHRDLKMYAILRDEWTR